MLLYLKEDNSGWDKKIWKEFSKEDIKGFKEEFKERNITLGKDVKIGDKSYIGSDVYIGDRVEIAGSVVISDKTHIGDDVRIYPGVKIGDKTHIGDDVCIYGEAKIGEYVKIGNNVRIGTNAKIGDNVYIGDSVIIRSNICIRGYVVIGNNSVIEYDTEVVRNPLYIIGSKHIVSTPKLGYIKIGCHSETIDWWMENYMEMGCENGYKNKEILEYYEYIKLFKKLNEV